MHLHFIESGPALLVENTRRVLVVADLHMGIESGLARHGVHIQSRSALRVERLLSCIAETDPELLLLLGDVKHNVPVTSRQEFAELPGIFARLRKTVPLLVAPGNHDGGIERFLREGELLPPVGAVVDGVGYLHGHTYPDPDLLGRLVVLGHHHPVVSLRDEVGCAARAQPAYLYADLDEECLLGKNRPETDERTRLLFAPAFNEFCGGIDVLRIKNDGLGPLSRCMNDITAEVFLADGTYLGTPTTLRPADGD